MSTLPDYRAALDAALDCVAPLEGVERVPIETAVGRVLAETVHADRDLPPFDRAQMDGYALRAGELATRRTWPVTRHVPAGSAAGEPVEPGHCVSIATGAPVPAGLDTVIPHEESDRGDPVRLTPTSSDAGRAIHPRGADAREGAPVIRAGVALAAHHVGIACAVGRTTVEVRPRPRAVVVTSGDEIVPTAATPLPHQIRNSNGPMTRVLLAACGAAPGEHRHVADDARQTRDVIGLALETSDVLVTVGGISAGDRDHLPDAFAAHGITVALRGAAIQPGKPIIVGRALRGTIVVGLPGNPVSALACTLLFAWPVLRRLLGLDPALPWRRVTLAEPVSPNPRRRAFRPATVVGEDELRVPGWAGSGDLVHTSVTDGLAELPPANEPLAAGARVRFLPWPSGCPETPGVSRR